MIDFIFRNSWWAIRKRPKIKIGLTLFDLIIEIAGFVAILAIWILLMVTYSGLPDVIPINLDHLGQVRSLEAKSSIFKMPIIATASFVVLTILSRFPRVFNYPVKITENNAFFQYSNMAKMIRCLNLAIVLIFGFTVFYTVLYVDGSGGVWFMPLMLVIGLSPLIPVIYFWTRSFKYR